MDCGLGANDFGGLQLVGEPCTGMKNSSRLAELSELCLGEWGTLHVVMGGEGSALSPSSVICIAPCMSVTR